MCVWNIEPRSARATVAMPPGRPRATSLVPSIGSTATSTPGGLPLPTRSPHVGSPERGDGPGCAADSLLQRCGEEIEIVALIAGAETQEPARQGVACAGRVDDTRHGVRPGFHDAGGGDAPGAKRSALDD